MICSATSVDLCKRLRRRHAYVVGIINGLVATGRLVPQEDFATMGAYHEAGDKGRTNPIYRLSEPACQLITAVIQGEPAQAPIKKDDDPTSKKETSPPNRKKKTEGDKVMSNIIPFQYEDAVIRTVVDDGGETMWVAKDIAEVLGYKNLNDAITKHCKGVAKRYPLQTPGGIQDLRVIHEPDLYRLITNSKLESAAKFEAWIFEVVLPSVRKNGGYIAGQEHTDDPELIMARALQVAQSVINRKVVELAAVRAQIKEQRPLVDFAEKIAKTPDSIHLGDFAKVISGNGGFIIGRNSLFDLLRVWHILDRRNQPYQKYVDLQWFKVNESTYENEKTNGPRVCFTTLITGKGQLAIHKRLTDHFDRPKATAKVAANA